MLFEMTAAVPPARDWRPVCKVKLDDEALDPGDLAVAPVWDAAGAASAR